MDARYACGLTALVRRRERFYGPVAVCWGVFVALFPKNPNFYSTKRVSRGFLGRLQLSTPGPIADYARFHTRPYVENPLHAIAATKKETRT